MAEHVRLFKKQGLLPKEYKAIHKWILDTYGKATECTDNNCVGKSNHFDWALIHGKKYDYDISNYKMLCRSCHFKYDYSPNRGYNKNPNKGVSSYGTTINQYSLEGEFIKEWNTTVEITNELGFNRGNLSSCINANRKSVGGFMFKRNKTQEAINKLKKG